MAAFLFLSSGPQATSMLRLDQKPLELHIEQ